MQKVALFVDYGQTVYMMKCTRARYRMLAYLFAQSFYDIRFGFKFVTLLMRLLSVLKKVRIEQVVVLTVHRQISIEIVKASAFEFRVKLNGCK